MSALSPPMSPPGFLSMAALRKLSVAEYQKLIDVGVLTDEDKVELLEGYLVLKMPANPPHNSSITKLNTRLVMACPPGYVLRNQTSAAVNDSRPEPDFAYARGSEDAFDVRDPEPSELALVVEVSDASL